ncbi:MAG: TlpA disulfide reductase family protein [Weeksellaceae bacterium]|nr:TlpA disulfide reductase family protein [Weeksellaceae bacterium]
MKKNSGYIISGVALVLLALLFFTPLSDVFIRKINEATLLGQSKELPDWSFNLNDENLKIELIGYNGTTDANLADFRGKVVFLNIWGSWCPPCVAEMPSIQSLYESKRDDVEFVLLTMQDRPEKFVPFLEENNYSMPVYEANSPLPKSLIPNSFPTTFIINKKGEVVLKETKSKDWNQKEIHQLLDKLINE